jgi:hypothetical protein
MQLSALQRAIIEPARRLPLCRTWIHPTSMTYEFSNLQRHSGQRQCLLQTVPDIHRHKTNRSNLESFFLSWPTRTCELLGAECHTAAWSGFALTHSHFCNKPVTMPQIWKRTLATASTSDWNFSTWTPAAVVINLGTVRLQALASNNNELIVLCPNKLNACMPRCRTIGMGCLQTGARLRCLNLSPISRTHFMTLWSTSLLQLCMVLRRRSSSLSGQ